MEIQEWTEKTFCSWEGLFLRAIGRESAYRVNNRNWAPPLEVSTGFEDAS